MMSSRNAIIVLDDLDLTPRIITTIHRKPDPVNKPAEVIETLPELNLPQEIHGRLFEHQRVGVNWMYNLYLKKSGGILGGKCQNVVN